MKLKVGDLVALKKYEDITEDEKAVISKESFPKFCKVSAVYDAINCFGAEEEPHFLKQESIDYIIIKNCM